MRRRIAPDPKTASIHPLQWRHGFGAGVSMLFACVLLLASCSTSHNIRSHTDRRAASLAMVNARAYQEAFAGSYDALVVAEGQLRFADGTTERHFIRLSFDGPISDSGLCKFDIADMRTTIAADPTPFTLERRCDGRTAQEFALGDLIVSIAGHPILKGGLPVFHIDSIGASKDVTYYLGRSLNQRS